MAQDLNLPYPSTEVFHSKGFLPPAASPLTCLAFEAGFHSLKLDLVLVLNSSESHSGLDATAAREIQLVRELLQGNSRSF